MARGRANLEYNLASAVNFTALFTKFSEGYPDASSMAEQRVRHIIFNLTSEFDTFHSGGGRGNIDGVLDDLAYVEGALLKIEATGFDFREVQNIVDNRKQRLARRSDRLRKRPLFPRELRYPTRDTSYR